MKTKRRVERADQERFKEVEDEISYTNLCHAKMRLKRNNKEFSFHIYAIDMNGVTEK